MITKKSKIKRTKIWFRKIKLKKKRAFCCCLFFFFKRKEKKVNRNEMGHQNQNVIKQRTITASGLAKRGPAASTKRSWHKTKQPALP